MAVTAIKDLMRDISDGFRYEDSNTIAESLEEVHPLLDDVLTLLKEHDDTSDDPTYTFWRQYLELVLDPVLEYWIQY